MNKAPAGQNANPTHNGSKNNEQTTTDSPHHNGEQPLPLGAHIYHTDQFITIYSADKQNRNTIKSKLL